MQRHTVITARIWNILDVDLRAKKITVVPAKDGERPLFNGQGADVHPRVREQMLKLLVSNETMPNISEDAAEAIRQLKDEFNGFKIANIEVDRPLKVKHIEMNWYTFQESKVNRSTSFLFRAAGIEFQLDDQQSCFDFAIENIHLNIDRAIKIFDAIDHYLEIEITTNPAAMSFSKYSSFLPLKYQILLLKEKQFDFHAAVNFLRNVNVVEMLHRPE
jgi:ATP-dependent Lhr-like helicase